MFMSYAQFEKRLQRLEQPRQSPTITEVLLYGQDEPEPPLAPGAQVIQITLGAPSAQGEAAGR
jgi:hypothetical protein